MILPIEWRSVIPWCANCASVLFHLYRVTQMPEPFRMMGFAYRKKADVSWL